MNKLVLDFPLWPKQQEAFNSPANSILYGGSAGGGKSHLERVLSIVWCLEIPGLQYYLFRRQFSDLQKSYLEGDTGYRELLRPLVDARKCQIVEKEIRFANGSRIYLCHCQHEKDVTTFGSFEFYVLNIAEAGEFTPFMIKYLRSRVRIPEQFKKKIPEKYLIPKEYWLDPNKPEYQFPRIMLTANPIGVGKAFLHKKFIQGRNPFEIYRADPDDGGMLEQFIPARLNDNPSLNPVDYASKLRGIGTEAYVAALLEGRWDQTVGAYFPQIDRELHLIKPFIIPDHWPRWMAYDHGACGSGDPFSCGWYTIVGDNMTAYNADYGKPLTLQRGCVICYRRWNGKGLPKMDAYQIARGILEREREDILFRVAGGDIIESRGHGKSIFSIFAENGVHFQRADMRRQNGWAQVDYRLSGKNDLPLSVWFEECQDDLETIGSLQHHTTNLNEIANGADDHDADRHRYSLMTCAVEKAAPKEQKIDMRDRNKRATPEKIIAQISKKKGASYVTRR